MNEKYEICKQCSSFNSNLKTCKECGCFMPAKTKVPKTTCPIGKW